MTSRRIREAGDSAVVVELGDGIDPEVNARAVAMAARLRAEPPAGVHDVLATFRSVAVFFDPLQTDLDTLTAHLLALPAAAPGAGERPAIDVPVEYGGEAGPDLETVAAAAGLAPEDVVSRHAARAYRVFMVGFLPGFAYLAPWIRRLRRRVMPHRACACRRARWGSRGSRPASIPRHRQEAGRSSAVRPRDPSTCIAGRRCSSLPATACGSSRFHAVRSDHSPTRGRHRQRRCRRPTGPGASRSCAPAS